MKYKYLVKFSLIISLFFSVQMNAVSENYTLYAGNQIDSLIESSFSLQVDTKVNITDSGKIKISEPVIIENKITTGYIPLDINSILNRYEKSRIIFDIPFQEDFLAANPFFIDLTFRGYNSKPKSLLKYATTRECLLAIKMKENGLYLFPFFNFMQSEDIIQEVRNKTLRYFAAYYPGKIKFQQDKLPDVTDLTGFKIDTKPIEKSIHFADYPLTPKTAKIVIDKPKRNPWLIRSNAMLQFSQSYISGNWYQGGSDNMSVLGILNGQFNYDNKKNIQWENFSEWRLGVNTSEGEKLRMFNTNDDIFRINSKLGIKAGGSWFYSGTYDFSTQFFNSYKSINSNDMKATFLTPVRMNIGVGLDYKYKKIFSLMLSPVSYKFIYVNDTLHVNQKSFGIKPGDKVLSQIGSTFRAQFSHSPTKEIQLDSKFTFYTNYQKVEIDWEIVGNFTVNRFLSTRLSLNPRYDNTVFLAAGEKAKIQFKELMTFGLSYKLL